MKTFTRFLFLAAVLAAPVSLDAQEVVNAAWWGFDPHDSTHALQSAIDSGAVEVQVPYLGMDWVVRPIKLRSNQRILFDPGVVVVAKKGEFLSPYDCLFEGIEVKNVVLRGYGAIFRMHKDDYRASPYPSGGWRHTLSLKGATNVELLGLTFDSSGGDGFYIGPTWDERRIPCRDIVVLDCNCYNNFRQGGSVVSVARLLIENCMIRGTSGRAPQAAIDLEPSNRRDLLSDVRISDSYAIDNAGSGLLVNVSRLDHTSAPVSVTITDFLVRGSRQPALRVKMTEEDSPDGLIEFRNCTSEDIAYSGATCIWKGGENLKLRFVDCSWRNVARLKTEAPLHFELRDGLPVVRSLEFVNCSVYDDRDRDVASFAGGYGAFGLVKVFNPVASVERLRSLHAYGDFRVVYRSRLPY